MVHCTDLLFLLRSERASLFAKFLNVCLTDESLIRRLGYRFGG